MNVKHFVVAMTVLACLTGNVWAKGGNGNGGGSSAVLSDSEAKHLIFLRQEEKLARDVYAALFARHKTSIFLNISAAEQTHMDSVKELIVRYNLQDPAADNSSCSFDNVYYNFTAECEQLIQKGKASIEAALEVGIYIEEMDIDDIENVMLPDPNVTKTDIRRVLTNLLAGSYNHLDAFTQPSGQ